MRADSAPSMAGRVADGAVPEVTNSGFAAWIWLMKPFARLRWLRASAVDIGIRYADNGLRGVGHATLHTTRAAEAKEIRCGPRIVHHGRDHKSHQ